MSIFWQYVISGLYVGFVYAILAFGALAYRQIIDTMNLKEIKLGEERYLLFDPRVFISVGVLFLFFCIFVAIILNTQDVYYTDISNTSPGLIYFALPAVFAVSAVQLYLRAFWQRTSVRTQGILVRRMLTEQFFPVAFYDIGKVQIQQESLWSVVVILNIHEEVLCTCRVSGIGLEKLLNTLEGNSQCTIEINN